MCAVSMVGDEWRTKISPYWPMKTIPPQDQTPYLPDWVPDHLRANRSVPVSREDFESLYNMVLEMKEDLEKAKQEDIDNNEPDCEMDEKVAFIKKVANFVGVPLEMLNG